MNVILLIKLFDNDDDSKVLLNSFHLNGNALGFHSQT